MSEFDRVPLPPAGPGGRFRWRKLPLGQEEAASQLTEPSSGERSLASYIPSALISTEQRAAALMVGGAPAWSRRLKRIDRLTDQHLADLEAAWRELARQHRGQPAEFATAWRAHADGVDFAQVNDLIGRHNLHFPAERRLPMDIHTGDYIGPGGRDYRLVSLDATWVLERFPPELEAALEDERAP